jgi:deoxycytidine triphosphate deaminase
LGLLAFCLQVEAVKGFERRQAELADPQFASDPQIAEDRHKKYRDLDPFPTIPPTLLNSADIADYVAVAGVIDPFHYDAAWLKVASYEVELGGQYVYWDDDGNPRSDLIEPKADFVLRANSIAFVTLEPMFRLPSYIALRFNLRITHVYQGLLLGTGPMVDPGFHGRLSLPLHNLTTNDYTLRGGDGLIWLELTKLSHPATEEARKRNNGQDLEPRVAKIFEIQSDKLDLSLNDYLKKADPHRSIRSSVPFLVKSAEQSIRDARTVAQEARTTSEAAAEAARTTSERLQFRITLAGIGALIALIFSAVSVYIGVHQVLDALSARVDGIESRIDAIQRAVPTQSPATTPVTIVSPTPTRSP